MGPDPKWLTSGCCKGSHAIPHRGHTHVLTLSPFKTGAAQFMVLGLL